MQHANKVIQLLLIALNGALIGAMILIALVMVPFWQSSEPQAFLDWFTAYSPSIGDLMLPLGFGVLFLAVVTFFLSKENKVLRGLTIVFILVTIVYYPIYYLPTNASFSEQTINAAEIGSELSTWLSLHWQRIFFSGAALVTSILAVTRTQSNAEQ